MTEITVDELRDYLKRKARLYHATAATDTEQVRSDIALGIWDTVPHLSAKVLAGTRAGREIHALLAKLDDGCTLVDLYHHCAAKAASQAAYCDSGETRLIEPSLFWWFSLAWALHRLTDDDRGEPVTQRVWRRLRSLGGRLVPAVDPA